MKRTIIAILFSTVSVFISFNNIALAQGNAAGAISDDQIHNIVERVAKHQIHPLADGDYPAVTKLDEAKAAKEPEGIMWDYPWGVALYGMEMESQLFQDANTAQFVTQHNLICSRYYHWLAGLEKQFGADGKAFGETTKIKGFITQGKLDNCGAMGNEMLEDMMLRPSSVTPEEKAVVGRIADWVVKQQDRMTNGVLWRPNVQGGTVWPDDLYMGGVFLARWGIYNHDQKYIDDAAQQIIHQAALLQDTDGLWFHGYYVSEKKHAPYKWGRGNGWVMVTLVETLTAMDEKDPLRPQLLAILRKQIDGLKKVQGTNGMWRQILDKNDIWDETSCTAMFAYGIARAVNRGWIDSDNMAVARKAFAGVAHHVTAEGAVMGTCQGTSMSTDLVYYIERLRPDDDPHGRGPVMLAGTEILVGSH
jgi:unsaturated rhamnogalacturonyl hydrolase